AAGAIRPSDRIDLERVHRFRARLSEELVVDTFRTPNDLAFKVRSAILKLRASVAPAAAGRVLLFVGHALDAPDRPTPRFPSSQEKTAGRAIREAVAEEIGRGSVAFGMACACDGGDILFLEACADLSLPTQIFLPLPEQKFVEYFVAPAGKD